jgi:pimeloyl-ACP methyl ester carboxylesterase
MKHTSVRVDGISSPLLEAGPREAAEAVVFVHGNPGSIADWTSLVASVGEFARALAMDMPVSAQRTNLKGSTTA